MRLELGEGFALRCATAEDHAALRLVCVKTGDSGRDATAREDDPDLLGSIYAVPYQVLEPDFAFVVEDGEGVCGYVLGALNTPRFNSRIEREWFTPLRRRVPDPGTDRAKWRGSDWARHLIHHPDYTFPPALHPHPSHGHIDLLPRAQGRGIGRQAMGLLLERLRDAGSPGLFLQLSPANRRARAFYVRLGLAALHSPDLPRHSLFMAKAL